MINNGNSYTFEQDIQTLYRNIDLLTKDYTPKATQRCCKRIREILDRIEQFREQSYIPYEIKQYFKESLEEEK